MNKDHAAFQRPLRTSKRPSIRSRTSVLAAGQGVAKAIDQVTIEVTIPRAMPTIPPCLRPALLDTRLSPPQVDTRVIINERKQIFIVGADVEIGPVAVMHKNRLIQIGNEQPSTRPWRSIPRATRASPSWSRWSPRSTSSKCHGRRDRHHQDAQAQAGLVRRADHRISESAAMTIQASSTAIQARGLAARKLHVPVPR